MITPEHALATLDNAVTLLDRMAALLVINSPDKINALETAQTLSFMRDELYAAMVCVSEQNNDAARTAAAKMKRLHG